MNAPYDIIIHQNGLCTMSISTKELNVNAMLDVCPALDSFNNNGWWPPQCNYRKNAAGASCAAQHCARRAGVSKKVCQPDGTWTPVGGAYCKKDPVQISITCPTIPTLKTSPGKATVDARGRFPMPMLHYPDSEVKAEVWGRGSIDALPIYLSAHLKFSVHNVQHDVLNYCISSVKLEDKEPPIVHRCPEEIHYVVPEGTKLKINFDSGKEVKIVDAVNSGYGLSSAPSTATVGSYVAPGNWTIAYKLTDSAHNEALCRIKVIVKSRPCKMNSVSTGSFLFVSGKFNHWRFYSGCRNGSTSMCAAWNHKHMFLDYRSCFLLHGHNGLTCEKFTLDPLPSCINDSFVFDNVNGTCPNGTVLGHFTLTTKKCFPCERSMFFNYTTKGCQLCPDNTTTYTLGNNDISNCIPCPKHQMTKLSIAPRFCEDICNPGSWLDASNTTCTKCPRGSYAPPGARSCTKCPNGLTTFTMESTDAANCVAGSVIDKDSGYIAINKDNITNNNVSLYHFRINWSLKPLDQINQLLAFKFKSSYLKQLSNCSKGYIRLYSIVSAVEFRLTENICGNAIEEPIFVRVMKDQPAFVEFHFTDVSAAQLSFRFGIANCSVGYYFNFTSLECVPCPIHTYRRLYTDRVCQKCEPGTAAPIPGAFICQDECPKGTMRVGEACQNCPNGFYQDEPEKTMCKKCSNGTSTLQSRTANITGCIDACGVGQYKHGNSCLPCPVGMFQTKHVHAFKMCLYCHSSNTTMTTGSSSCVEKCSYEGEYYNRTESKCKKCPIGTYKLASLNQVDVCTPCPTNHTTNRTGAASITECICITIASQILADFPRGVKIREQISSATVLTNIQADTVRQGCMYANPILAKTMRLAIIMLFGLNGITAHVVQVGQEETVRQFTTLVAKVLAIMVTARWLIMISNVFVHHGTREDIANIVNMSRPCVRQACSHRGNCINGPAPTETRPATYTCNCSLGYTGKDCEKRIDYCVNNTCDKAGTYRCLNFVGYYECFCRGYYRNANCNESYGCDPGEYMVNEKCFKCKKGTFQLLRTRSSNCHKCYAGKTTIKDGSSHYTDCIFLNTLTKLVTALKITSETWTDKLLDKTSTEFKSLASKWEETIKKMYSKEKHFKNVDVNYFKKGSVVCNFTVYFTSGVQDPKGQLSRQIENGTLGSFSVDKNSLNAEEVESTKIPPHKTSKPITPKKKNYTLMIVLIIVGVVLVLFIVSGYLYYSRNKQKIRIRFAKMAGDKDTVSMDFPLHSK
eukprot:gene13813-15258_t